MYTFIKKNINRYVKSRLIILEAQRHYDMLQYNNNNQINHNFGAQTKDRIWSQDGTEYITLLLPLQRIAMTVVIKRC